MKSLKPIAWSSLVLLLAATYAHASEADLAIPDLHAGKFNIFGQERCHIILNDDLQEKHGQTLKTIFAFLEVDDSVKTAEQRIFEHDYAEPLDPGLRSRLIEMFYFDIRELERMLGRDLSEWYTSKSKRNG